ncbi:MAG: hypothetical protein HXY49_07220 [Ignavibacteriaceae bacterium]|nr:hypothetical protein [Ignavibacteriaceae bacterium]
MSETDKKNKLSLKELWNNIDFTSLTTLSLITSNAAIIVFALIENWSAQEVLAIYWLQSVIIGIFNVLRILSLKEFSTKSLKTAHKNPRSPRAFKVSTAIFFLVHYGFFHFVYAMFIGSFYVIDESEKSNIDSKYLLISTAVFFINYLIEFIKEKNTKSETLPDLGKIMFAPYLRIIPMHITVTLGGFVMAATAFFSFNAGFILIIILMVLKTFIDLITHSFNLSDTNVPALIEQSKSGS